MKPTEQLQAKEPGVLTQMPSCSQGEPEKVRTGEGMPMLAVIYCRVVIIKHQNKSK